jgi:hypothetical protein
VADRIQHPVTEDHGGNEERAAAPEPSRHRYESSDCRPYDSHDETVAPADVDRFVVSSSAGARPDPNVFEATQPEQDQQDIRQHCREHECPQ